MNCTAVAASIRPIRRVVMFMMIGFILEAFFTAKRKIR